MTPFSVSDKAKDQATALGLHGDLVQVLWDMYSRSTPYTHPHGNRRFEGLIFLVRGNTVHEIQRLDKDFVEEKHRKKALNRLATKRNKSYRGLDLTTA